MPEMFNIFDIRLAADLVLSGHKKLGWDGGGGQRGTVPPIVKTVFLLVMVRLNFSIFSLCLVKPLDEINTSMLIY